MNCDNQFNLNGHVGVKPGRHVLPAPVPQVEKRIASEANQDDEPRQSLHCRAQAEQSAISAVGCKQYGETGKGQQHHRCELTDVEHSVDVYLRFDEERHLRVEELLTRQDQGSQDLRQDHQE